MKNIKISSYILLLIFVFFILHFIGYRVVSEHIISGRPAARRRRPLRGRRLSRPGVRLGVSAGRGTLGELQLRPAPSHVCSAMTGT